MNDPSSTPPTPVDVEAEIQDLTKTIAKEPLSRSRAIRAGSRKPSRVALPFALLLLCAASGLTIANIVGIGPFHRGLPEPTAEEQDKRLELDALATIGYIDAYQEENQILPDDLTQLETGVPLLLTYERIGESSYRLYENNPSRKLIYESPREQEEDHDV